MDSPDPSHDELLPGGDSLQTPVKVKTESNDSMSIASSESSTPSERPKRNTRPPRRLSTLVSSQITRPSVASRPTAQSQRRSRHTALASDSPCRPDFNGNIVTVDIPPRIVGDTSRQAPDDVQRQQSPPHLLPKQQLEMEMVAVDSPSKVSSSGGMSNTAALGNGAGRSSQRTPKRHHAGYSTAPRDSSNSGTDALRRSTRDNAKVSRRRSAIVHDRSSLSSTQRTESNSGSAKTSPIPMANAEPSGSGKTAASRKPNMQPDAPPSPSRIRIKFKGATSAGAASRDTSTTSSQPVKHVARRGRPPKNRGSSSSSPTTSDAGDPSKRRRGRPRKEQPSIDTASDSGPSTPQTRSDQPTPVRSAKRRKHAHLEKSQPATPSEKPTQIMHSVQQDTLVDAITAKTNIPARDAAIQIYRERLVSALAEHDRKVRELFHLETRRNMFLYNESQLQSDHSPALHEYLVRYGVGPILSAGAVHATVSASERATTRRSLRAAQVSLLGHAIESSSSSGSTIEAPTISSTSITAADDDDRAPAPASRRIAPSHGSLEALLESYVFIDDEPVLVEDARQRARHDAYVLNRASRITKQHEHPPRVVPPAAPGPDRSYQSALLLAVKQRCQWSTRRRQARSHLRSIICRAIERLFEERRNKEERGHAGERRHQRQLARQVASLVRKAWQPIDQIVHDKRKMQQIEEEKRRGRRHLQLILEHSSRLLSAKADHPTSSDVESPYSRPDSMAPSETGSMRSLDDAASMISSSESDDDERSSIVPDDYAHSDSEESDVAASHAADNTEEPKLEDVDLLTALEYRSPEHSSLPTSPPSATMSSPPSTVPGDDATYEMDATMSDASQSVDEQALQSTKSTTEPEDMSTSTSMLNVDVPFLIRHSLRSYQLDGLRWLAQLDAKGLNGILADEMGLGKTIQTIALFAYLACEKAIWGPHLVVVPTSVLLNWTVELKKWCPGLKVITYYGSTKERKEKRRGWSADNAFHVCITTYQLVIQDQAVFRRRRWSYMVLDEAHNIKNFRSQRWQTLLSFRTQHRLLLTGTPLQNNLTELWSLLYFLMPGGIVPTADLGFASQREFHEWFGRPIDQIIDAIGLKGDGSADDMQQTTAIVQQLHTLLRPYLLRRIKADVEQQLPGKYEHTVWCRLSKRQRQLYDEFMSRARTRETLASGNYLSIINCLMQLRKVCNHPDLFEPRPVHTSFAMSDTAVLRAGESTAVKIRRWFAGPQHAAMAATVPRLHGVYMGTSGIADVELNNATRCSTVARATPLVDALLYKPDHNVDALRCTRTLQQHNLYLTQCRHRERMERWRSIDTLNLQRCERRPVYGGSLLRTLSIVQDPPSTSSAQPSTLSSRFSRDLRQDLNRSLNGWIEQMQDIIDRFTFVVPTVSVRPERSLPDFDGRRDCAQSLLLREARRTRQLDPLYPIRAQHCIGFPDKRLLQYDCGKLQVLDRLLRHLKDNGSRTLIFTQMTRMLDILEAFLNMHGYRYLRLDGATKVEQRQAMTERFNADTRIFAFILSTRSGGIGINLTGADSVIFYDSDWNPFMDKQCQDRCHRIGQTRDVHIYRLVSEHTIESNILHKANQKRMLDTMVIQKGDFTTDFLMRVGWRDALDNGDEDVGKAEQSDTGESLLASLPAAGLDTALAQVEDDADVRAMQCARKEAYDTDLADMADYRDVKESAPTSDVEQASADSPMQLDPDHTETDQLYEDEPGAIEEYMLRQAERNLAASLSV